MSMDLDTFNQTLRLEALTRGVAVLGETMVDGKSALKIYHSESVFRTWRISSL